MGWLTDIQDRYQRELERRKNKPFMQAVMAAAAMVAIADGKVSFPQRARLDQIIEAIEILNVFDPHEAVDIFKDYVDDILADRSAGHDRAMHDMLAAADDKKTAELIVRVCLAVMHADREPALADEVEIVSICSMLGVPAENLGLYIDRLKSDDRTTKDAD